MDVVRRIFMKTWVRAITAGVIALVVMFAAVLVPMTSVYAEKFPSLRIDSMTVRVGEKNKVRINNIDEDQICEMAVQSEDPSIVSVEHNSKPVLIITGHVAYEETVITAKIITYEDIAGQDRFTFSLRVRVCPDRELAPEGAEGRAPDYSKKSDWMHLPANTNKPVDTFYIYSTQYKNNDFDAPELAPMDDPDHRENAKGVYRGQAPIFEASTNVFAPYYRQTNMKEYRDKDWDEVMDYQRHEQKLDICNALDYYFDHYNNGRPFIIAGHSQGGMMTLVVLEDYMRRHPEYYDRMVAAYVLGFSVTKRDLIDYPHLKFAEGAKDTGVIISWNTEGKANKNQKNFVVAPEGSIAINPINWKRDETYAPASKNLGSRVQDPITGEYSIKKNWGDARVDTERGVVVTKTKFTPNQKTFLYGTASYHSRDVALYFMNLRKNVRDRVKSYLRTHKAETQQAAD